MTVAMNGLTRSIAVIGRKRSAQDSWDDACASYVLQEMEFADGSRAMIQIPSTEATAQKDLIFNPKEKTNAEEVFNGRDRC
jgi:hypothetical protein